MTRNVEKTNIGEFGHSWRKVNCPIQGEIAVGWGLFGRVVFFVFCFGPLRVERALPGCPKVDARWGKNGPFFVLF